MSTQLSVEVNKCKWDVENEEQNREQKEVLLYSINLLDICILSMMYRKDFKRNMEAI